MNLLTPDEIARLFKLHHCIGSKSFARQVKIIQGNAMAHEKAKKDIDKDAKPVKV